MRSLGEAGVGGGEEHSEAEQGGGVCSQVRPLTRVPWSTRAVYTGLSREEPGAPVTVRKSASGGRGLNSVNVPIFIIFLWTFCEASQAPEAQRLLRSTAESTWPR